MKNYQFFCIMGMLSLILGKDEKGIGWIVISTAFLILLLIDIIFYNGLMFD